MKRILYSVLVVSSILLFSLGNIGCEDDPILQPRGTDSASGGSYGRIDLAPDNGGAGAGKVLTRPKRTQTQSNPKVF